MYISFLFSLDIVTAIYHFIPQKVSLKILNIKHYYSFSVIEFNFIREVHHFYLKLFIFTSIPGRVAKWVMWLAADTCLTADSGVASSIPARSHTFMEIDHEIINAVILLPSADSRRVVISYKRKYVHEVLVNCLFKLPQEKSVVRWTDRPGMTIAVDWDVKNQTPQKYLLA